MLGSAIAVVDEGLDALARVDLAGVDDASLGDAIVDLGRIRARAEAAEARLVARFDARRACEADGARSTAAWLAHRRRESKQTARHTVTVARLVRDLPEPVRAAFDAGAIGKDHLFKLRKAQRANPVAFDLSGAEQLLAAALERRFVEFAREVDYWCQVNDPDGVEGDARDEHEQRTCHASETWRGMVKVDAFLDRVGGAELLAELQRLYQELFDAEWAAAKARLGRTPTVADLDRTPGQRRADALVLMARRSAATPPGSRMPRPLIKVLVDYPTFAGRVCELYNGTVMTPGTLAGMLTDADVERIVFGPGSRVIDIGRRRRFFEGALRDAVETAMRTCAVPSCDEPADGCEIDHVVDYDHGGPTIQENGQPLCRWHHRRKRRHPAPREPDDP